MDLSYTSIPLCFYLLSNFLFLSSQQVNGVLGFNSWAFDNQKKYVTVPSLLSPIIVWSSTNLALRIAS